MLTWLKKVEHYKLKKCRKKLKVYTKMENIITKFGDIEIQKQKFYQYKIPISTKNIDINKIVVSCKVSFGRKGLKYFIGYKNALKSLTFMHISSKNECI